MLGVKVRLHTPSQSVWPLISTCLIPLMEIPTITFGNDLELVRGTETERQTRRVSECVCLYNA